MASQVEKIFKKVEFLKDNKGCTDKEIAEHLSISASGYSRIKNLDRRLTIGVLEDIANFFEVPLYYFVFTESDLDNITIDEELEQVKEEKGFELDELADYLDMNVVRTMDLLQGFSPTPEEIEKLTPQLPIDIPFDYNIDGRIELMKLLLKEMGLEGDRIGSILEYINQSD